MMKFSAIVALVLFATADAATVTWGSATRSGTLLAGANGGNIVVKFTPTTTVALSGSVTLTASTKLFTNDVGVSCIASAVDATTQATFKADETLASSGGTILTLKLNGEATDIFAASKAVTITCAGSNLEVNTAAGTAVTFSIATSTDTVLAGQVGWTPTSAVTAFTATRSTSRVTGLAPGNLVFGFTPTTALAAGNIITLTSNVKLFTADNTVVACTATYADIGNLAVPTFDAANTKASGTGKILTLKLNTQATDKFVIDKAATITCTDNMDVNTAAGAVTFTVATTTDIGPSASLTGYTICAATGCPTSAASSTASVGMLTMLALAGVAMRQ